MYNKPFIDALDCYDIFTHKIKVCLWFIILLKKNKRTKIPSYSANCKRPQQLTAHCEFQNVVISGIEHEIRCCKWVIGYKPTTYPFLFA